MITKPVLDRIRAGTCAVGRFKGDPAEALLNRSMKGESIVGTGFLVRPGLVITAAHVLNALNEPLRKRNVPENRRFLQFLYPRSSDGQWQRVLQAISGEAIVDSPRRPMKSGEVEIVRPKVDVGFLEFDPTDNAYQTCLPLPTAAANSIHVGQHVGVCGYPYGQQMLLYGEEVYRFGPVIQQGYISAVAPIDAPGLGIQRILLDVRAAGGLSGAPVFLVETGEVIGVLTAGWNDRFLSTSFATPLSTEVLSRMLEALEKAKGSTKS